MNKLIASILVASNLLLGCTENFTSIINRRAKIPVDVSVLYLKPEQNQITVNAIWGWNKLLKLNYFTINSNPWAVRVMNDQRRFSGPYKEAAGIYFGPMIVMREELEGELLSVVAYHELGHLIGLNHSTDKASIMYPNANLSVRSPSLRDVNNAKAIIDKKVFLNMSPLQRNADGLTPYSEENVCEGGLCDTSD